MNRNKAALKIILKSDFTMYSLLAIIIFAVIGWWFFISSMSRIYSGDNVEIAASYAKVNPYVTFTRLFTPSLMLLGIVGILSINVKRFLNLSKKE